MKLAEKYLKMNEATLNPVTVETLIPILKQLKLAHIKVAPNGMLVGFITNQSPKQDELAKRLGSLVNIKLKKDKSGNFGGKGIIERAEFKQKIFIWVGDDNLTIEAI